MEMLWERLHNFDQFDMKMRGTIKSGAYFKDVMQEIREIIEEAEIRAQRQGISPEKKHDLEVFAFTEKLHLCIASYSAGLGTIEIRELWKTVAPITPMIWEYPVGEGKSPYYFDSYVKLVWILSLGVLLGMSNTEIAPLAEVVNRAKKRDWLLDFLLFRGASSSNESNCHFPQPYGILRDMVVGHDGQERIPSKLREYLGKHWYPSHSECYWYNNHLGPHNTYVGYWSFEAAAVVKILGIDDSSFRDSPYYPKDLL
jgi:hypothetical protein